MIRSFVRIYQTDVGVNPNNMLVMRLFLPEAKYPHDSDQIAFHDRLRARLEALPGVQSATIALTMPTGGSMSMPYELAGAPVTDEQRRPNLAVEVVSSNYFQTMDVPVLRGRAFNDADGVAGTPVAIVNQRMAEKFWPGDEPLGKRLRVYDNKTPVAWLTVVGVVPNILQNDVTVN